MSEGERAIFFVASDQERARVTLRERFGAEEVMEIAHAVVRGRCRRSTSAMRMVVKAAASEEEEADAACGRRVADVLRGASC